MISVSLKLEDGIFQEAEKIVKVLRKSRNAYINEAVAYYNLLQKRVQLSEQLAKESALVRESSLEVLGEMESLENDYDY